MRYIRTLASTLLCGLSVGAQTAVDLQTQSKAVNFQNAPYTKPMKSGTVLPATCTTGDMFFLTATAPGANVYGCAATNTWAVESGGGGGSVVVENGGVAIGSKPILNFVGGAGISLAISDTGTKMLIQPLLDSASVPSYSALQSGAAVYCESTSGSASAFTCGTNPSLVAYTKGLVLQWRPDVNGAGGAMTLNVDLLGAVPVKLEDGVSDPGPLEVVTGRLQTVWYDGNVFRLVRQSGITGILGEAQPTCSAQIRGRLWFVAGNAGVKDSVTACAKDAAGVYAWRTIY